jgi:hypothetical protein
MNLSVNSQASSRFSFQLKIRIKTTIQSIMGLKNQGKEFFFPEGTTF